MRPDFNKMELIPVIVQDYQTKEVLMLAYVNEEAYDKMLELKQTVFYSRSRQKLWHKGEESGHFQDIKGMYLDCDLDTLLIYVKQTGAACHTGAYSCFFNEVQAYDARDIFRELEKTIADRNNITCYDCYTGFKWIASVIRELEGKKKYIGGGEESYGFLAEDFARDKDAVSAISLMAEVAAWAKDNGKTVYEMLQDIYLTYGFSKEKGISVVRKGKSGAEEIEAMMKNFRNNPMTEIAGSKVILTKDFSTLVANDLVENEKYTLDMPTTSNVLQYFTEDGTKVSIRPSGTEPKIKFYIEVKGELKSREDYDKVNELANQKIEAVKVSLGI